MSDGLALTHSLKMDTNLEKKFIDAKAFLQTSSAKSGLNVYEHLSKLLTRILSERPNNAAEIFEDLSKQQKFERFVNQADTLIEKPEKSSENKLAEVQKYLFMKDDDEEEAAGDGEDIETPLPNLNELSYYFEQAGVGVGREETFRVLLALKQLVDKHQLEQVRFWGKIFGTEQNYYVAEVKFESGKEEEEEELEEAKEEEVPEKDENEEVDIIPKPLYKPPPVIQKEEAGVGCNKQTYFVCNAPGKPWVKLPHVTPHQIQRSRQIKKLLTGRLDAAIVAYPPFPGNEANYVRAQIARISAGTQISPNGFYRFDEEGEEANDEDARDSFVENEEFEGINVRELADPALNSWVHHVQHVLPQGRTKWLNPKQKSDEEEMGDEEDGEEDRDDPTEEEPERGPPLLSPLSEDTEIDGQPAWTAKVSSNLVAQYAICVVRSNLWPGAYAFGIDKKFENIYIGWGQKYSVDNLNPALPPLPLEEYSSGPEITEADDPTPQDEAQHKKENEGAEEQEGEAEEEEEEVEEEDN